MLMAAGRAQEHISSGVPMAPVGAVSAGLMVQIRPKEGDTGEAETQNPLLLGLESAAPR